jgi:negative regulator of genetic competence, sporulation and motility
MLTAKYQTEQSELTEKVEALTAEVNAVHQTESDAEKWLALIRQYAHPTELTAELLNALIDKILVHESVESPDGCKEQEIEIFYRFIGKID